MKGSFSRILAPLALLAGARLLVAPSSAQVPLSAGTYNQSFDSLFQTGSANPWTNNLTIPGWYAARATNGVVVGITNYRASTGTDTAGALYSFGVAGAHPVTDRALGSIASGTSGTIAHGLRLANDTSNTIGNLTVSYTGEQWRNGGNTATQTLAFSYRVSNTAITDPDPLNNNAWTSFSALDFKSPTVGPAAAALDGNAATNRQVFSNVLLPGVAVQPGQEIFLRWVDVNDPGNDHALAVDDLTVAFTNVHPTDIYWANSAGGDWDSPANWNPPQVPGPYDHAFIVTNGTYIVVLTNNASVGSVTLGGSSGTQTLLNSFNTLVVFGNSSVNANGVVILDGTLSGPVTASGLVIWDSGTIGGPLTVATNGLLVLTNQFNAKTLSGALTNLGTVRVQGGTFSLDGGSIYNQPGGLFEIDAPVVLLSTSTETFNNAGRFLHFTTGTSSIQTSFNNTGVLDLPIGVISFSSSLSLPASSTLKFTLGGVTPPVQYGQMTLAGALHLGGTLLLTNTYGALLGDSYRLINCAAGALSGGFLPPLSLALPSGSEWVAVSDPVGVSVVTESAGPLTPSAVPVNQTVAVGQTATFSITPGGLPPFAYQWRFNNLPLAGQTNASLVLANVQFPNAGTYCVVVTDASPATTTNCATLQVLDTPSITNQLVSQTVSPGTNITFTASVSGTGTLAYQWRLNGDNIIGATSSTYTLTNVQPANGGVYGFLVGNQVSTTHANPATFKVSSLLLSLSDNFAGGSVTNSASGVGSGSNTNATRQTGEPYHAGKFGTNSVWFQWQAPASGVVTFSTVGSSFDTLLAAYTGTSLTNLVPVAANDDKDGAHFTSEIVFNTTAATVYNIAIDGLAGAQGDIVLSWNLVTNSPAVTTITQQPADVTVSLGDSVTFSIAATNANSVTYQWYYNGSLAIPGATGTSLTLSNITFTNVGFYTVELTQTNGQIVRSDHAGLEIGPPTVHSFDKLADLFINDAYGTNFPAGLPRPLFAFPSVSAGTIGFQAINTWNATSSQGEPIAQGTGGPTRWFELSPTDKATMVIWTTNSGVPVNLAIWTGNSVLNLAPVTSDTQHTAPDGLGGQVSFLADGSTSYLVQVYGADGVGTAITIIWKLGVPPTAVTTPQFVALREGATLSLQADVGTPTAPTYQWRRNGANLPEAAGSAYSLANVQFTNGGIYSVIVSNLMGAVTNVFAVSIQSPLRLSPDTTLGPVNCRMTGSATQEVVLLRSPDLFLWMPLFTNSDPTAPINYLDTTASSRSQGFYRLAPWP